MALSNEKKKKKEHHKKWMLLKVGDVCLKFNYFLSATASVIQHVKSDIASNELVFSMARDIGEFLC